MTSDLNDRLNECAKLLNDGKLLAILSGGDAIAQELKYHLTCLTGLYNRKKSHLRTLKKESSQQTETDILPLVLSELVNYILETCRSSDGPTIFRLADMTNLYQQRLEQLGVNSSGRVKEHFVGSDP